LRRSFLLLSVMFVASFVSATTAAAAGTLEMTGSSDPLVVLSGRVDVPENTHVAEVVVFHGPVTVEGMVHGDVVALDGPVSVSGIVTGSVVALNGPVSIEAGAHVVGDVVSREAVALSKDARIDGTVQETSPSLEVSLHLLGFVAWWIPVTFSTLLLGLLMLWWFPKAVEAAVVATHSDTARVVGWGLLVFVGLPVLSVFALITLVGFPFGIGLMLASGFLYSMGYVLGMSAIGERMVTGRPRPVLGFIAGWAALRIVALVPYVSGLFTLAAIVVGLGGAAAALRRRRSRSRTAPEPPAVAA